MTARYLEDFEVGQTYGSGRLHVEEEGIKSFAAEFDPQPFHLDADAARASILRGLAASGWHTAALTMRLLVDSELKPAGGIVGVGFDELRWPRPVRPGDELQIESEVLEGCRPNGGGNLVSGVSGNVERSSSGGEVNRLGKGLCGRPRSVKTARRCRCSSQI